jgi:diphosphomevalonate decarboxylase
VSEATVRACANIALAKYWGKRDAALNLPAVGSISATLSGLWVEASVRLDPEAPADTLTLDGKRVDGAALHRLTGFLDLIREQANRSEAVAAVTESSFPHAAGLASSAAAFAAFAIAASEAYGLDLGNAELSALARRGSGSAARSVYGGYVEMPTGDKDSLHAVPLAPAEHWPLHAAVLLCATGEKAVSSRKGMNISAETSPYYRAWVKTSERDIELVKRAIQERQFELLAATAEHNCLKMHAVMTTSRPPLLYWNQHTVEAVEIVGHLRSEGLRAFYTIDAGPNPVVFFEPADRAPVLGALEALGVEMVVTEVGGAPIRG